MGDRDSAVFDEDLIAIHVVAMMVAIEREPDWFVRDGANCSQYLSGPRRKIGVDHQHIVLQNDPPVIADRIGGWRQYPRVEVDVRRYPVRLVSFGRDTGRFAGQQLGLSGQTQETQTARKKIPPIQVVHALSSLLSLR